MMGPERAAAEQQRNPRPREVPGGEPEALPVQYSAGRKICRIDRDSHERG
jgi:hypothetical protein